MSESLKDLYDQGLHQEVIEAAKRSTVPLASDPPNSLIVAASLLQMGHLAQCRQVCEGLVTVLGSNPQFLSLYATCLRRLGDLDQSQIIFQKALKQHPDLHYLNNNYANLLIERGELDKAQQILENILKAHPAYADAEANLQRLQALRSAPSKPSSQQVPTGSQPALADPAASAAIGSDQNQPGQQQPVIVDPLDLAFSEEEVEVEQRERRKRKSNAATRPRQGPFKTWTPLITLPPIPAKELEDELAKAGTEALFEQQPEAALLLADLLQEFAQPAKQEALQIAADAFLMQKRYAQAEITLLSMQMSGVKLNADQVLNIVAMALKRNDLRQAEHFLEQAQKLDPTNDRLEKLSARVETLRQSRHQLAFSPYDQVPKKQALG